MNTIEKKEEVKKIGGGGTSTGVGEEYKNHDYECADNGSACAADTEYNT